MSARIPRFGDGDCCDQCHRKRASSRWRVLVRTRRPNKPIEGFLCLACMRDDDAFMDALSYRVGELQEDLCREQEKRRWDENEHRRELAKVTEKAEYLETRNRVFVGIYARLIEGCSAMGGKIEVKREQLVEWASADAKGH